jgi:uncharacterized phiE125 gp8 family phage protein
MDTANALVTLNEVKEYLRVKNSSDYDEIIEMLIDGVSHKCNSYTNRLLVSRELTEYYDGNGKNYLFLNQYPVTSDKDEIEIYVDTDREYGDDTKVDASEIIIDSNKGKITLEETAFSSGAQTVKVVYTGGYTVTGTVTLPYDLREAVRKQIKFEFTKWKENREGRPRITIDVGTDELIEEDLLPEVVSVWNRYRDMHHG